MCHGLFFIICAKVGLLSEQGVTLLDVFSVGLLYVSWFRLVIFALGWFGIIGVVWFVICGLSRFDICGL